MRKTIQQSMLAVSDGSGNIPETRVLGIGSGALGEIGFLKRQVLSSFFAVFLVNF